MAIDRLTNIEGFVTDLGFTDMSKVINGILINDNDKVASQTPKTLSYFTSPYTYTDSRTPSLRSTNWFAETSPSVTLDNDIFGAFINTINQLTSPITAGFFKLIDKLAFNYSSSVARADLEASLLNDTDIAAIYVPNSFVLSTDIKNGVIHYKAGTTATVPVPSFIKFSINITVGGVLKTYVLTLYLSVSAFLTGYDVSTIVKIIPPLSYDKLYSSSLTSTTDNIFLTSAATATLSFNALQSTIGTSSNSGITQYRAVIVDQFNNTAAVPFNIVYKGRSPTLSEVRESLKTELLNSGFGTADGWAARIPGVFVAGRFYIVPLFDQTYTKPDQVLLPSIVDYKTIGIKTNTVLASTGFGDISQYIDVLPIYYNKMTVAAVPDLTGVVDIHPLIDIIPDYQSYSPEDDNFVYMSDLSKSFATQLNQIIAADLSLTPQQEFFPITENLLTFYSFVIGKYEICVITKLCYNTILRSSQ